MGDKPNALSTFIERMASYGVDGVDLSSLAVNATYWKNQAGNRNATVDQLMDYMRNTDAYRRIFPNIDQLKRQGFSNADGTPLVVNEANYMTMYKSYKYALKSVPGFYDTPEDVSEFMLKDISPTEVARRVAAAKEFVANSDEGKALQDLYNVPLDTLTKYVLDPEKSRDEVTRTVQAVRIAGAAQTAANLKLTQQQAELYAQDTVASQMDASQIRDKFATIGDMNAQDERLAGIEGDKFNATDNVDAVLKNDREKLLKSRERATREAARWSGSSGVNNTSLGGDSF
jgi:hypothetical protein